MAARIAASLAICALLAFCLAAVLEASSVSSEHGNGFPCGNVIAIRIPHGHICDRSCGGLCVELFMWKYPDIKAVVGDCTPDNAHQCECTFYC